MHMCIGRDVRMSRSHRAARATLAIASLTAIAACSSESTASSPGSTIATTTTTTTATETSVSGTTSTTSVPPATSTSTSTTTTTSTSTSSSTSTSTSTSTTTSTTIPAPAPVVTNPPLVAVDALAFPTDTEIEIGRSVEGRPITVIRRGSPNGTRVLAIGAIHGNEAAGTAIIDRLATDPVPDGVELWLVRSMNPDGQAIGNRQNAHDVDLNRNFPENWDVLGVPGDWQYGGPSPASEPETQAIVALGDSVRPDLILWYHQDLFRIAPGSGRSGEIRIRYAQVAGLPIVDITGGTYTGTASQWSRTVLPELGVGITVELGPTLGDAEVTAHIAALAAVTSEFW